MPKLLRCVSCGSHDIRLKRNGYYECSYCGSLHVRKDSVYAYLTKAVSNHRAGLAVASAMLLILALTGVSFYYAFITSPNEEFLVTSVEAENEGEARVKTLEDVEPLVVGDQPGAAPKVEARLDGFAAVVDIIGGIYFSGLYHNSGEAVITYPKVTVFLYDAADKILDSGYGYGTRRFLMPGEKTVIRALISNAPDYDHYTVEYTPKAPSIYTKVDRMKMAVTSSQMKFSGNGRLDITGTVKNKDNRTCAGFKLQALVYRDGNIIGSGLEVWTSSVAPSQQVPFSMYIPMAIDTADTYIIDISGEPAL